MHYAHVTRPSSVKNLPGKIVGVIGCVLTMTGCPQWETSHEHTADAGHRHTAETDQNYQFTPDMSAARFEDASMEPPAPWWNELSTTHEPACPPNIPTDFGDILFREKRSAPLQNGGARWRPYEVGEEELRDIEAESSVMVRTQDDDVLVSLSKNPATHETYATITGVHIWPITSDAPQTHISFVHTTFGYNNTYPPLALGSRVWFAATENTPSDFKEHGGLVTSLNIEDLSMRSKAFRSEEFLDIGFRVIAVTSTGQIILNRQNDLVSLSQKDHALLWARRLQKIRSSHFNYVASVHEGGRNGELFVLFNDHIVVLDECGRKIEQIPARFTHQSRRVAYLKDDYFVSIGGLERSMIFFNRDGVIREVELCTGFWTMGNERIGCLGGEKDNELTFKINTLSYTGELLDTWDVYEAIKELYPDIWLGNIHGVRGPIGLGGGKFALIVTLPNTSGEEDKFLSFLALAYDSISKTWIHQEIKEERFYGGGAEIMTTRDGEILWPTERGVWSWKVAPFIGDSGPYPRHDGDFSNQTLPSHKSE